MPSPAKDPLLGRTIAQRYRLISRLGAGSVARVYLARHVLIDRLGAIKIAHAELGRDPVFRERFLREARAVNRVNHPNIVEITDFGEADGLTFLVMEYVPGESLEQILERGPIGWRRAAAIGEQIAGALGRAHEMGIIHRDLKPANVLVVPRRGGDDLAKLTDFGGAKLGDAAPLTVRAPAAPTSPHHGEADARADLFALGVVLHEAATGAIPEAGASEHAIAALAPDAPPFFTEVLSTLLAADPEDRPRDGFEAADLLRRALAEAPRSDPRSEPPSGPRGGARPPPPELTAPTSDTWSSVASAPLDRLSATCDRALDALEEQLDAAEARGHILDHQALAALDEARRLTSTVRALSELVSSDTRAREVVRARGRAALAELGKRLDDAAREHSRALGWAGTIAERSYQVEARRLSGEHPVPAVEAMVWEQAALEQEEDLARDRAARLDVEMRAYKADVERHNERLEQELLVVNACLEGRIAALRSLAAEAWSATLHVASLGGIGASAIGATG